MKNILFLSVIFLFGCNGNNTGEQQEEVVIESQWTTPPDGDVLLMPDHIAKLNFRSMTGMIM